MRSTTHPARPERGRRSVDLDPGTLSVLQQWRQRREREAGRVLLGADYVFATPSGAPVHPDSFSQTFQRLVVRSRLPGLRLHDLRHTHATLLLKERVPIKVVSERLGHAHPGFTMATYQDVLPGMQAAAAEAFAALIVSTGFHPVEGPAEDAQTA